jgi:DNA/RNA-binding domain of Phe-tRNA-synthetase-like protein
VAVDGDGGVSEATRAAAYNLDAAINDLTLKFAAGTDFFQLLVQVCMLTSADIC